MLVRLLLVALISSEFSVGLIPLPPPLQRGRYKLFISSAHSVSCFSWTNTCIVNVLRSGGTNWNLHLIGIQEETLNVRTVLMVKEKILQNPKSRAGTQRHAFRLQCSLTQVHAESLALQSVLPSIYLSSSNTNCNIQWQSSCGYNSATWWSISFVLVSITESCSPTSSLRWGDVQLFSAYLLWITGSLNYWQPGCSIQGWGVHFVEQSIEKS